MSKAFLTLAAVLFAGLFSASSATALETRSQQHEDLLYQIRELDLLNQILPVLFTKAQLKEVLPIIERAHADELKVLADEKIVLRELEADVAAAREAAYKEGQVPSGELMRKISMTFTLLQGKRRSFVEAETAKVVNKLKEVLNEGQIAAAANSLDPAFLGGGANIDELEQDQKLRLWAQYILLDPAGYDVLIKLYEELPE